MSLLSRPRRVGASEFTRNYYDQTKRISLPVVVSLDQEDLPRAPAVFPLVPKDVGGCWSAPPLVNPSIWRSSHQAKLSEATTVASASQRQRAENKRISNETQNLTKLHESNVSRRLDDRRYDVTFWHSELERCHVELSEDVESLKCGKDRVEKQHLQFSQLLDIARKCIQIRDERTGIELVEDESATALRQEIKELIRSKEILEDLFKKNRALIRENLSSLHHLSKDIDSKKRAIQVDSETQNLTPFEEPSRIIPKQQIDPSPMAVTDWRSNCTNLVARAEKNHDDSVKLRALTESLLTSSWRQVKAAVEQTKDAMDRRIEDLRDAKMRVEKQHSQIVEEEGMLQASLQDLKSELEAKKEPLSIAQTRLDTRRYRPITEQTRDEVEGALLQEVTELELSISRLLSAIHQSEEKLEMLNVSKKTLEHDINLKIKALHLDQVQVMKLRSTLLIDNC